MHPVAYTCFSVVVINSFQVKFAFLNFLYKSNIEAAFGRLRAYRFYTASFYTAGVFTNSHIQRSEVKDIVPDLEKLIAKPED